MIAAWLDPHVDQYLLQAQGEYVVREVHKHWAASVLAWARFVVAVPVVVSAFAYVGAGRWILLLLGLALFAGARLVLPELAGAFPGSVARS